MEVEESSQNVSITTIVENLHITDSITVRSLTDLSIQYIQSAALYARLCYEVENRHKPYIPNSLPPEEFDELLAEHDAHAISSIFAAVAFLESTINKFFLDAVGQIEEMVNKFSVDTKISEDGITHKQLESKTTQLLLNEMIKSWVREKDVGPVHEKFDNILGSFGKEKFNRGDYPFQDIALLVNLRNALVHYKPEWVTVYTDRPLPEEVDNKKLEQLRKKHIPRSPFIPGTERQFFPKQCLSHGHAKWAVNVSLAFVDGFFEKMNRPYPYNHIRSRLRTEF